jgi:hypothetical protein
MPTRREILEQVASGELGPEEADRLLRDLDPDAQPSAPASDSTIRRVKVSMGVGRLDILGDPSIAQAVVDGPHRVEVIDDSLVIHGEWGGDAEGFSVRLGRHRRRGRVIGPHGITTTPPLRVRMNPALALEAELDAGPLSISGVEGPIRARLSAGPITIEGFRSELDLAVNAGAVRANGKLTQGESRIRSDAGAVRVVLDPSSSVHVIAHAALGKVVVPGGDGGAKKRFAGDRREAVIGNGDGVLRVETAMGSVHVTTKWS